MWLERLYNQNTQKATSKQNRFGAIIPPESPIALLLYHVRKRELRFPAYEKVQFSFALGIIGLMKEKYHRAITGQALRLYFEPAALEEVIRANVGQDALRYQFGHDHFHYDNNAFAAGDAYIAEQRRVVLETLQNSGLVSLARAAFGRLIHAAQDFYAHSNYTALWRERHPEAAPAAIEPSLADVLNDPRLLSGRIYSPLEYFSFLPLLAPLVIPLLPRDSHAWMNRDDPSRPDFDYAYTAALKRTEDEFEQIRRALTPQQMFAFTMKPPAS